VDKDCASRQQSTQDQVTDYNGEGATVVSNAVESEVAMMAAMMKGGNSRQQR
jgi:hypothetical protein